MKTKLLLDQAAKPVLRLIRNDREAASARLASVLEILERRLFHLDFNVGALWREAKVKDKNASDLFRELDTTPASYIAVHRVEVAKRLLTQTPLEIWNIAQLVGYNSHNTFGDVFKRITGDTPSEYRKKGGATRKELQPVVEGLVALDEIEQDYRNIFDCIRAALDQSHRAQSFEVAGIESLGLAHFAYFVARSRLQKRERGKIFKGPVTKDVNFEQEMAALAGLVFGTTLLRNSLGEHDDKLAIETIRSSLGRLAGGSNKEVLGLMNEQKIPRVVVRECLFSAMDLDFSAKTQVIEIAVNAFEMSLLGKEDNPDEYRLAYAWRANIARISTNYSEAVTILNRIDVSRPFSDQEISAMVSWIAAVVHAETGASEVALRLVNKAISLFDTANLISSATKARISKGAILVHRGVKDAYTQFQICLNRASGDPVTTSWSMVWLFIAKYYLKLDDGLPFEFAEFVNSANCSARTRAWIPYCNALMERRPGVARDLFLRAEKELAETAQSLQATCACLFAAVKASEAGEAEEACQLGVKAATALQANQAFGGRLALAAELFLADLITDSVFDRKLLALLETVQMPYRS